VTDELARWVAERAPELRARAETEAVAVMRDALVAAALGDRPPREAAPASASSRERPATRQEGQLFWAYCVLPTGSPYPTGLSGVDPAAPVERIQAGGLAALVSRVPRADFGEEPLRENLNDLAWLERAARAHEGVLDQSLSCATIVPLRLCTLYETEDSVREMLTRERDSFALALDFLAGREEWGVKVLIDPDLLAHEARAASGEAAALEQDMETREGGGAYMLRRRLERHVRELSGALAAQVAERVHTRLEDWALDAVERPPQNRDLSKHEGEMVLNAAYLVAAERVGELRELVRTLEAEHSMFGARIELTGPWPPYNFVPGGGTETIA
jgi:hypothetical protein